MSKSTPLSQLVSEEESPEIDNSNAYDEKENQLVQEILTEINNEPNAETEELLNEINELENEELQIPRIEEPEPVINESVMESQSVPPLNERLNILEDDDLDGETPLKSMQDEIISRIKLPLLVGGIVVLFSTPLVSKALTKLVPSRDFFQKNLHVFILLVKFIISSIVFMGLQFAV